MKNFPGHDLLFEIRHQPCVALLDTLRDGLANFDENSLLCRTQKAVKLHEALDGAVICPGFAQRPHNHWVFPILAEHPERLLTALARAGFDAILAASMRVVPAPVDRPELAAHAAAAIAERLVYLPCYPQMPDAELNRLATIVKQSARPAAAEVPRLGNSSVAPTSIPAHTRHQLQ